jgi:hypothetical protein
MRIKEGLKRLLKLGLRRLQISELNSNKAAKVGTNVPLWGIVENYSMLLTLQ